MKSVKNLGMRGKIFTTKTYSRKFIAIPLIANGILIKVRKFQKRIVVSSIFQFPNSQWYMRVRRVKIKVFKKLLFDGVST